MQIFTKEYHQPKCPYCNTELLYQEVYLKGRTYKIQPEGLPGTINLTPNAPEVLEFQHLICGHCNKSFKIKFDKNGKMHRGTKS